MKIIIVGGGESGRTLNNLLGTEHQVTIIDSDEELVKDLAEKTDSLVIHGEGTDISILKEAGIEQTDAIVAATNDDKTNLMISQIAKSENIKRIIPLVHNPNNEELFTKLGIKSIVSVTGTNAVAIRNLLYGYDGVRIIAQLGEGDTQIIEEMIYENSNLIGKNAVINDAVIAAIYRHGELIIPDKNSILEKGDVLLVAVKTKNLPTVAALFNAK